MIIPFNTILHYGLPGVISQTTMAVQVFDGVFSIYLYSIGNGARNSGHIGHESHFSGAYSKASLLTESGHGRNILCVNPHQSRGNTPVLSYIFFVSIDI
jgi:hypothetical protein